MHETALMQNMLAIVEKSIGRHNVKKVNSITLSVGKLANAMPDALSFAFEASTVSGPLKGAALIIKEVPASAKCEACGNEYVPEDFPFICPVCNSRFYTITQGEDIYIESIDCEI
jgi:hydrogenase nickel incorporation protein HypA/HybF